MAKNQAPPATQAKDIVVDLLVIGSGTGMAAALTANELGLSTLIVEKTQYVGGSTARSGGAFWMPANRSWRKPVRATPLSARRHTCGRWSVILPLPNVGGIRRQRCGHRRHALPHDAHEVLLGQGILRLPPRTAGR